VFGFCAAAVVYFAILLPLAPAESDDAFITFRYGRHLASGAGLVWNVGEPPVEGYTSPLWVLLAASSERLGVFPLLTAKLVSVGAVLLSIGAVMMFLRNAIAPWTVRFSGALLIATSVDVVFFSMSGMENVTFMAGTVVLVSWLSREISGSHAVTTAVIAGVLCWLRPEGHLAALVSAWRYRAGGKKLFAYAAVVLGVVAPLHVFRLWYFGYIFPNTYYAKHAGGSPVWTLFSGLLYLSGQAAPQVVAAGPAIANCFLLERRPEAKITGAVIVGFFAYVLLVGGDDVSAFPGGRLLLPVTPLLFLHGSHFFSRVFEDARAAAGMVALFTVTMCALEVPALVARHKDVTHATVLTGVSLNSMRTRLKDHLAYLIRPAPLALSDYILKTVPPSETIAVPWAGRVPYETMRRTIDLLGLNDPHIAHQPKRQRGMDVKYDADYVLARRPFLICENVHLDGLSVKDLVRLSDEELYRRGAWKLGQRDLLRHPALLTDYEVDHSAPRDCLRRRPKGSSHITLRSRGFA